ncbi:MAG: hypothetical protein AB7N76_32985 [Planctomycetota bacterium]
MSSARRLAAGLWALALAGCASPGEGEAARAEAVARALARSVRVHYDQRLAAAGRLDAPSAAEVTSARAALDGALRAAGLQGLGGGAGEELGGVSERGFGGESIGAVRNLLLRNDWVFPPAGPGGGLVLARVRARRTNCVRELWGLHLHYRVVVHAAPLVLDYLGHAALRTGQGSLPPAARAAGHTVFLDEDALARRAGQGPYAGIDAAALAEQLELQEAATLRVGQEVSLQDGAAAAARDAFARVWLSLLRYGDVGLCLRRLRWETGPGAAASPWRDAAAFVRARCPRGETDEETRARAARLYRALSRGELRVPPAR